MQLAGTFAQARSQRQQGSEAALIAEAEASMLDRRGAQSRAIGSIQAQRIQKAVGRIQSRQRSLLAASGFDPGDATGAAIEDATAREGSIQALLAVAQAEDEARMDEWRAQIRRAQGQSDKRAANLEAQSTLINGLSTWRELFGRSNNTNPASSGADGSAVWRRGSGTPPPFLPEDEGAY